MTLWKDHKSEKTNEERCPWYFRPTNQPRGGLGCPSVTRTSIPTNDVLVFPQSFHFLLPVQNQFFQSCGDPRLKPLHDQTSLLAQPQPVAIPKVLGGGRSRGQQPWSFTESNSGLSSVRLFGSDCTHVQGNGGNQFEILQKWKCLRCMKLCCGWPGCLSLLFRGGTHVWGWPERAWV